MAGLEVGDDLRDGRVALVDVPEDLEAAEAPPVRLKRQLVAEVAVGRVAILAVDLEDAPVEVGRVPGRVARRERARAISRGARKSVEREICVFFILRI